MQGIDNNKETKKIQKKAENICKVIKELRLPQLSRKFYHYTSIEVLFSILENDSMWITNTQFSNDGTEEKLLKTKNISIHDNYMACFCDEGNQLSQWRGYCPRGGASIELELNEVRLYSILDADYEKSRKYKLVYNTPIPVIYIKDSEETLEEAYDAIESICKRDTSDPQELIRQISATVPFWKNDKFKEEKESRLIFSNEDGEFSNCIRFRTLPNKAKVPYMVMKMGDVSLFSRNCQSTKIDRNYLDKIYNEGRKSLWIPEGSNQEKVLKEVNILVDEFNNQFIEEESFIKVYCAGHLPIKKITIAPTYDRERIMEQVKRFCQSKYWLRNVEVVYSDIPYISPAE